MHIALRSKLHTMSHIGSHLLMFYEDTPAESMIFLLYLFGQKYNRIY